MKTGEVNDAFKDDTVCHDGDYSEDKAKVEDTEGVNYMSKRFLIIKTMCYILSWMVGVSMPLSHPMHVCMFIGSRINSKSHLISMVNYCMNTITKYEIYI